MGVSHEYGASVIPPYKIITFQQYVSRVSNEFGAAVESLEYNMIILQQLYH